MPIDSGDGMSRDFIRRAFTEVRRSASHQGAREAYNAIVERAVAAFDEHVGQDPARAKEDLETIARASEALARRTASPHERQFIAANIDYWRSVARSKGVDLPYVALPPFSEDFALGAIECDAIQMPELSTGVRRICEALGALWEERIDKRFTYFDLYVRAPTASRLYSPVMAALKQRKVVRFLSEEAERRRAGALVRYEMSFVVLLKRCPKPSKVIKLIARRPGR